MVTQVYGAHLEMQCAGRGLVIEFMLGLRGYQIWRTIAGIEAAANGDAGPQAVLLGPARR